MPSKIIILFAVLLEWEQVSGYFSNELEKPFSYECDPGEHIYFFGGTYNSGKRDRFWNFDCRKGFVSTDTDDCIWQNQKTQGSSGLYWVECAKDGNRILTGIKSTFNSDRNVKRQWKLKCCKVSIFRSLCLQFLLERGAG